MPTRKRKRKKRAGPPGRRPNPWQVVKRLREQNNPLIYHMIRQVLPDVRRGTPEFEDAEQVGREALWQAARLFDRTRNIRFSTYACKAIYRVLDRLRDKEYACGFSGCNGAAFEVAARRRDLPPQLADPRAGIDDDDRPELLDLVRAALAGLDERDRMLIEKRYLCSDPPTYEALAAGLGVTKERVRQLLLRAVDRLRAALGVELPDPPPEPEPPPPPPPPPEPVHLPPPRPLKAVRGVCIKCKGPLAHKTVNGRAVGPQRKYHYKCRPARYGQKAKRVVAGK